MREASYSTIRYVMSIRERCFVVGNVMNSSSSFRSMGGYEVCKVQLGATDPASTPLWKKIVAGGISGAVGAAIANPTDLVKGAVLVFLHLPRPLPSLIVHLLSSMNCMQSGCRRTQDIKPRVDRDIRFDLARYSVLHLNELFSLGYPTRILGRPSRRSTRPRA